MDSALQADRDLRDDDDIVQSEDEGDMPSQSLGVEGSEEEGEDLMDNMEA